MRDERLNAGNAQNARNTANARWIERASVSLKMPKPKMNGSGDAYQTWNSDQAAATQREQRADLARGLAPAEVGFLDELLELAWLAARSSRLCGHALALDKTGRASCGPARGALSRVT